MTRQFYMATAVSFKCLIWDGHTSEKPIWKPLLKKGQQGYA